MSFRKRYFFFDIDGTLIPSSESPEIPASARKGIDELRRQGHFCCLATGRSEYMSRELCQKLGFDNLVCDGGYGLVLEGRYLGTQPLDREKCLRLAEECDRLGYAWAVSPDNNDIRLTRDTRFVELSKNHYMRTVVKEDLDLTVYPEILKMYVGCPPAEVDRIAMLKELPWTRDQDMYLFVEPADKAAGIRRVMDHYGAPYEDVVVFGDQRNDLSMFYPEEWTCIAMGNACDEVKARATFVTRDVTDDGIAYALQHFGWIDASEGEC